MPQLVFIHGPGAGGCADAYHHQLKHFPGSVAPTLPGHLEGTHCPDVKSYTEWVRGWLWAQGKARDLVLVGYTLGGCIAIQYALEYPDEVAGLVVMTTAMRPKTRKPDAYEKRRRAIQTPEGRDAWMEHQRPYLVNVEPSLRELLLQRQQQVGPVSQLYDLETIDAFDVRDRIHALKPKLLLIRGLADISQPPEYEKEIHEAVPGSRYVKLEKAGHFPATDDPAEVNQLIEEFVASL